MRQIEFDVPPGCSLAKAESWIESVCAANGLDMAMKASLAGYPGSIHWHYRQPRQKGTLELTLLRANRRIWAQIHTTRDAPGIAASLPRIRKEIEQKLNRAAEGSPRRLQ
jgi:hypothetical protein